MHAMAVKGQPREYLWVCPQQGAEAQKGMLLLNVIPDAAQRVAPGPNKVHQVGRYLPRGYPCDPPQRDRTAAKRGLVIPSVFQAWPSLASWTHKLPNMGSCCLWPVLDEGSLSDIGTACIASCQSVAVTNALLKVREGSLTCFPQWSGAWSSCSAGWAPGAQQLLRQRAPDPQASTSSPAHLHIPPIILPHARATYCKKATMYALWPLVVNMTGLPT